MCSSTSPTIGGGIGVYCEFFKAAQSAGFDNFEVFLWYTQRKWPLVPWKVKMFGFGLLVLTHAVLLRYEPHRTFVYDSKRLLCKLWKRLVFGIFIHFMTSSLFQQFQERCLRQNKTVERWVTLFGFPSSNASVLSWPIVVHFKQRRHLVAWFSKSSVSNPVWDLLSIDSFANSSS